MLTDEALVYTPTELIRILRRSRSSVYADLQAHRIPSIRLGGRLLIPKKAIEDLLAGTAANTSETARVP